MAQPILGVSVGIHVGPTTIALLVSVLALAALGALLLVAVGLVFPRWVDRRWPATQGLSDTEQVWAQMRQYVERTFVGLDLALAKELAEEMERVDAPAGTTIFRQGEPATHFFIIESGAVEVSQQTPLPGGTVAEQVIRRLGPGAFFGEVAIMRRSARTATVRTVEDSRLLRLPADDFLVAASRSAADQHLLLRTVDRYLADDRRRAETLTAPTRSWGPR